MSDADTIHLNAIRQRHREASTDWVFTIDETGETAQARQIPAEDHYPVLTFSKECTLPDRELVTHAHEDVGFLLVLLGQSFRAVRELRKALERNTPKPTDHAAKCAMRVKEPDFQLFMQMVHGVENSHDHIRVENRVKTMLAITSKKELDTNPEALKGWEKLVSEFYAWNKRRRN